MSRTHEETEAQDSGKSDAVLIKLYQGVDVSDSTAESVWKRVSNSYENLYDNNKIPGYYVRWFDSDFDRSDNPNKDAIDAVDEWLDENNYRSRGFHLGLHSGDHNNPGVASAGSAWTDHTYGHTYCGQNSNGNIANTAIHESFHKLIDTSLSSVQDMTGDGDRDGAHTLGKVWKDENTYRETPLGSRGASPHGDCDGEKHGPDVYNDIGTSCEKDAIKYTHDDKF